MATLPSSYPNAVMPSVPAPDYASPMRPVKVAFRPQGLKVIAILGVIHASVALVSVVMALVVVTASGSPTSPMLAAMKGDGFLRIWLIGSSLLSFGLAMVLLMASVSAMSMRSWARKALMLWGLGWLFLNATGLVLNLAYLYPIMDKAALAPPQALLTSKVLGVSGTLLFGIIWPAIVVFYSQEKRIKDAFERAASAGAVL